MKTLLFLLVFGLAVNSYAGRITVKVVHSDQSPASGAKVVLSLDGGGVTNAVRTGSDGKATVSWSSSAVSGKVIVNGSTVFRGRLPDHVTVKKP
tara:strand:+ start:4185 stop:4466 length:282 start_codon:yes stop_codon:yes gene_type:complete